VAWDPKLFHWISARLWYGQGLLWPFVWPTGHTAWLAVSILVVLAHPPTLLCGTHYIAGCVQKDLSKPDSPAGSYIYVYVSVIIAIDTLFLLQFLHGYKSRNMHICIYAWSDFQNQVTCTCMHMFVVTYSNYVINWFYNLFRKKLFNEVQDFIHFNVSLSLLLSSIIFIVGNEATNDTSVSIF